MKMINKLRYSTVIFLAMIMATSCGDTEEEAIFSGSFLAFSSSTAVVLENSADPLIIDITMGGPLLTSDLTIDYSVEITVGSASDFMLSDNSGTLTIPAGQVSTTLELTPVDNVLSDGAKEVTISIESASADLTLGLPGPSSNNKSIAVTIGDDDCPVDLASFVGTYSLAGVGLDNSCCLGFDICAADTRDCSGDVTLTVDASDPSGTTAILQHASFGRDYIIKFITCTKETEVLQDMTTWFGNDWPMSPASTLGTYDEGSKAITIHGLLGGNGDFEIQLTKN